MRFVHAVSVPHLAIKKIVMFTIMEYIRITKDNLDKEHICCAISNNNDVQVSSKKSWLLDRFDDGLVFLKSAERGKCFIENQRM